jgi:glycosyltransferase involved in cell wall biosynthesis
MDLSVVIPIFNERDNIRPLFSELLEALAPIGRSFEVLFVNDGSSDGSAEVLRELRAHDRRVRVLTLARNAGQTAAFSAGFSAARGAIVVTLDGDRQNDPRDIPLLLDKLGDFDAAVGWRAQREDTIVRRVSSRLGNFVRNRVSGDDIIDTGCSLKAYRREALARIKLFSGMHRFLPTLLKMEGFRVCQVRVSHRPRVAGRSKYGVWNRLLASSADLMAVRWMKRRALSYRMTEED